MPRPKQPRRNPIHAAVSHWLASLPGDQSSHDDLVSAAPKRFTMYAPMALLPTGSFTQPAWAEILRSVDDATASSLWTLILQEISKNEGTKLTHLAVNEGIPLHKDGEDHENILRSPSGLRILHGDFGRSEGDSTDGALWVSTRQNGIFQTWAPRWTMFSRGNVKEKARLLEFPRSDQWAVDLYAGIGYFVFSYAALGMRVLCWEMNPWSVEGLRRGARANRWSVRVVCGDELRGDVGIGTEQITVFLEDNQNAMRRIRSLRSSGQLAGDITHVNCGMLPTSELSWRPAWHLTEQNTGEAWLHLHDNVGVDDLDGHRQMLQGRFTDWQSEERSSQVTHVEKVKTFAPGVWHCVFDVHITRSDIDNK